MHHHHQFLFKPGIWLGQGKIGFSTSSQEIEFVTRWKIPELGNTPITCIQEVEMHTMEDKMENRFIIDNVTSEGFSIEINNELIGSVKGTGVVDERVIAWEFRGHENFDGFEVFERVNEDEYTFHAEYSAMENFRTIIDGKIWRKVGDS